MKEARKREALNAKYIFLHHPYFAACRERIIALADTQHHFLLPRASYMEKVTSEGVEEMVVHQEYVLIGISERTSREAAAQAIRHLFDRGVVSKATIIKIPNRRDYMHIDTVFTQMKRGTWVMLGDFSNARIKDLQKDKLH